MAGELTIGRRVDGSSPARLFSRQRRGNAVQYLEILLDECDYPDGGWTLNPGIHGMAFVTDAELPGALDPYGVAVGHPGVQLVVGLGVGLQGDPTLKIYSEGGFEVEEGWAGEEGDRLWLGLIGVR